MCILKSIDTFIFKGHKKGNFCSLFCNYLFFSFAQEPTSLKRKSVLSQEPLSQKKERPLSYHSK